MQSESISRNALISQPMNRNVGFSRKSEAEPARRTRKFEMPPVVQIIPRAATGKNAFEWKARFDMSRTKLIVSEDVEKRFGIHSRNNHVPWPCGKDWCRWATLILLRRDHVKYHYCGKDHQRHRMGDKLHQERPANHLVRNNGRSRPALTQCPRRLKSQRPRSGNEDNPHTRWRLCTDKVSKDQQAIQHTTTSEQTWYPQRRRKQLLDPFHLGFQRVVVIGSNGKRMSIYYTASWYVWREWFLAVNHHNHKNWVPFILIHNLWLIFMGMKQKK